MANDSQGTPGNGNPSLADSTKDTPRDLLRKLRDMQLFASLTDEQFKAVSDLLRIDRVERTTLVTQQGGNNTHLYLLRHGRAVVRMVGADEKDHFLQDLDRGRSLQRGRVSHRVAQCPYRGSHHLTNAVVYHTRIVSCVAG